MAFEGALVVVISFPLHTNKCEIMHHPLEVFAGENGMECFQTVTKINGLI